MKVERRRYVDPCESVISVDQGPIKHSAEREHHLQHVALRDRGYNIGGVFDCQESNRERAGCKTIHSQEPLMRERSMRNARWADAAATAILCVGICGALPATFAELPASMLETPPPRGMAPLRPQLRPLEGGAQLEEGPVKLKKSKSKMMDPRTTQLHAAVSKGEVVEVQRILAAGASANSPGAFGFTPLHVAASNNRPGVVAILAAHGGQLGTRSDMGW